MKMIIPSQIGDVIRRTAQTGAMNERADRIDLHGLVTPELFRDWKEIAANGVEFAKIEVLNDVDDVLDLATDEVFEETHLRFTVTKPAVENAVFLFSAEGLATVLSKPNPLVKVWKVFIAEEFTAFSTETCEFVAWQSMPTSIDEEKVVAYAPRKIVKDLGGGDVPTSLGPFLLKSDPPVPSKVFDVWKDCACRYLFVSLVNEIWEEDGKIYVSLTGPRKRKLELEFERINSFRDFPQLHEAAKWIYASGRDIEVKHTLFTHELAREWPEELSFTSNFAVRAGFALDAAKTSFFAHIRETSKDTLKSLSDLRKTLGEDVAKIIQQTRDVLSNLWKDFAIAATAILGKAALSATKSTADPQAIKIVLLGTAVFLAASYSSSIYSNHQFYEISKTNRTEWRRKLYGFLPEDDLRGLADQPIEEAERVYKRTIRGVGTAYAFICIALVLSALK